MWGNEKFENLNSMIRNMKGVMLRNQLIEKDAKHRKIIVNEAYIKDGILDPEQKYAVILVPEGFAKNVSIDQTIEEKIEKLEGARSIIDELREEIVNEEHLRPVGRLHAIQKVLNRERVRSIEQEILEKQGSVPLNKRCEQLIKEIEQGAGISLQKAAKPSDLDKIDGGYYALDGEVVHLKITGARLQSIPDAMFELSRLEILDLSDNVIQVIPETIGRLKGLRMLALNNNRISKIDTSLRNSMENLVSLHLDGNLLDSLANLFECLKDVKVLSISNNQIGEIPDYIALLKDLEVIRLEKNPLKTISSKILEFEGLRKVSLDDWTGLSQGVKDMMIELRTRGIVEEERVILRELLESIKSDIFSDRVDGFSTSYVCHVINGHVTNLEMSSAGLEAVPDSIGNFSMLSKLHLRKNKIRSLPESVEKLANTLVVLDLTGNDLDALPKAITSPTRMILMIQKNPRLKKSDVMPLLKKFKQEGGWLIADDEIQQEWDKYPEREVN
ncbi:MAG: leucine-rich repeat protein [Candidatus Hodarchaeota archaeon]